MLERGLSGRLGSDMKLSQHSLASPLSSRRDLCGLAAYPRIMPVRGRLRQQPAEAVTAGDISPKTDVCTRARSRVAVGELLTAGAATRPSWSL